MFSQIHLNLPKYLQMYFPFILRYGLPQSQSEADCTGMHRLLVQTNASHVSSVALFEE